MNPSTLLPVTKPVLQVQHLGKEYRLYNSPRERLKSLLFGLRRHQSQWVLQDVSFTLHRGQCLGVVGNNGAGKSSLLKLITGTLQPTAGQIRCDGRITAILELGAGFHPDFSGRDNLFFAGRLIGIAEADMVRLASEIIAFSELGDAIDRPVKAYSSGMVVRLAFALVTAVEPDVLIIDEALAVGDQHFQKKCIERIEAFRRNGCTILFCSHSTYHIRHLCTAALWLDQGKVQAFGDTENVLAAYEAHVRAQDAATSAGLPISCEHPGASGPDAPQQTPARVATSAGLVSVEVANLGQGELPLLNTDALVVHVVAQTAGECPSIGVMLEQLHGTGITSVATHADGVQPKQRSDGLWEVTLTFPDFPLHSGDYVISAYLFDAKGLVVYEQWLHCRKFKWVSPSLTPGLVRLPHFWR